MNISTEFNTVTGEIDLDEALPEMYQANGRACELGGCKHIASQIYESVRQGASRGPRLYLPVRVLRGAEARRAGAMVRQANQEARSRAR